jgi:hypothetical protein
MPPDLNRLARHIAEAVDGILSTQRDRGRRLDLIRYQIKAAMRHAQRGESPRTFRHPHQTGGGRIDENPPGRDTGRVLAETKSPDGLKTVAAIC